MPRVLGFVCLGKNLVKSMKKQSLLLLCVVLATSAFAQSNAVIKTGAETMHSAKMAQQVTRQLTAQKLESARGADMAGQISRQVAAQMTRVVLPLEFVNVPEAMVAASVPSQLELGPKDIKELRILPEAERVQATVFPSRKLDRHMPEFDDLDLYSLLGYRQHGVSVYRGMVLKDLQELKYLLVYGMQIGKTEHDCIYTSRHLGVALDYASRYYGNIPVVVQVPVTDFLLTRRVRMDIMEEAFNMDIPAHMISNVMVFLKINKNRAGMM